MPAKTGQMRRNCYFERLRLYSHHWGFLGCTTPDVCDKTDRIVLIKGFRFKSLGFALVQVVSH